MSDYISREEKNCLTQKLLKELFTYKDGMLFYKTKGRGIKVGERSGNLNKDGYRHLGIKGHSYAEHRLIFLFHKGYVPEFVDHIDTIKDNNMIDNLRGCTKSQNCMNSKVRLNITGVKGLGYRENLEKPWITQLLCEGKYVLNKSFYTKEEAVEALEKAREKHHKQFANNG